MTQPQSRYGSATSLGLVDRKGSDKSEAWVMRKGRGKGREIKQQQRRRRRGLLLHRQRSGRKKAKREVSLTRAEKRPKEKEKRGEGIRFFCVRGERLSFSCSGARGRTPAHALKILERGGEERKTPYLSTTAERKERKQELVCARKEGSQGSLVF